MAAEQSMKLHEAYPMTGGDGPRSYAKNSSGQKAVSDSAKELVKRAIVEKLDKEILLSFKTFRIADLGCSVGPNTYIAVQNILEAVESKYQQFHQIPEFQVFYNDHSLNDFNLLFTSLPQNRKYYAAGVPGSFYGRLFPEASLHFVYSSYAIQWLSGAPKELMNKSSPAWNKSRIHYANSGDEVVRAYKAQYHKDIGQFLQARAQEIVHGGLMVLIVPGVPNGTHHSQSLASMSLELLGSCLMDMARKGIVSEEKVDTFNVPIYIMSPQELKEAVEENGSFSIEIMEDLPVMRPDLLVSGGQYKSGAQVIASHMRAGSEGLFKNHFGEQILDVLFDSYRNKIEENSSIFMSGKVVNSFVLLKRKLSTSKLAN